VSLWNRQMSTVAFSFIIASSQEVQPPGPTVFLGPVHLKYKWTNQNQNFSWATKCYYKP